MEVEKLGYQNEQTKLSLQQYKLDLIRSGRLKGDCSVELETPSVGAESAEKYFDILGNLHLLSKI